jgi:hypothetical protein
MSPKGEFTDDLAGGIQIADKTKFFSFTTERILTLDYEQKMSP